MFEKTAERGRRTRRSPGAARIARDTVRAMAETQKTGLEVIETGAAAAQVIAARGTLIGQALLGQGRLDDPEFARMVDEKLEAGARVMAALGPFGAAYASHGAAWWSRSAVTWSRVLTGSTSPAQALASWQRLASEALLANAAYGVAMLGAATTLVAAASAPLHRAATANAARLALGKP